MQHIINGFHYNNTYIRLNYSGLRLGEVVEGLRSSWMETVADSLSEKLVEALHSERTSYS